MSRNLFLPSRWSLFALIFAGSGLAGLVHESIWSHYLRLLLGSAAEAQALVLALFMGGMGIGAWWAGALGERLHRLIHGYAVVEGIIGIAALLFHHEFVVLTQLVWESLMPMMASASARLLLQWAVAGVLVLPLAILLGMSFPLMAGAWVREQPDRPGQGLALLYFCNSAGAAVGALLSGFWLIEEFGLAGAVQLAGLLNLTLAVLAIQLARHSPTGRSRAPPRPPTAHPLSPLLAAALLTGAASFIYEVTWIRLLSLVLGSTQHSFELMLSAFITGLALGGWWIHRRIDRIAQPLRFVGSLQVVMGVAAIATLALYDHSYRWIAWLMESLPRSDDGYLLYILGSHLVAFVIMVPAAICAGMTLPLLTLILLQRDAGERSIGRIYAANTIGSISGVAIALLLMPVIGLKSLLLLGAGIDILLGVALLGREPARYRLAWSLIGLGAVAVVSLTVQPDPLRMASGVFRSGSERLEGAELIEQRHGRSATISTYLQQGSVLTIATNGKPDATLSLDLSNDAPDEITQALLAALPLALHPSPEQVAVIGFGSGLTSHLLLESPEVVRLNTIEIEPEMVAAARPFYPRVWRAFDDPRSHLALADARGWFATSNNRFDLIVSEPSNPWVSGVDTLFTREFYDAIANHLAPGGVLVQWVHLYEFNDQLFGGILNALGERFADYAIYLADDGNALVVAAHDRSLPHPGGAPFDLPEMARLLERVGVAGRDDLLIRLVGKKRHLAPLFRAIGDPAYSDYHPRLASDAPRARFRGEVAEVPRQLALLDLPLHATLYPAEVATRQPAAGTLERARRSLLAKELSLQTSAAGECPPFDPELHRLARTTIPYLEQSDSARLWPASSCLQRALYHALSTRSGAAITATAEELLARLALDAAVEWKYYLLGARLLGGWLEGRGESAMESMQSHSDRLGIKGYDLAMMWMVTLLAAGEPR